MKALVLAGGTGTRLRPFSHSMPKQLIPVANKPVLEHVLENIAELDIDEVGIVVGDRAPQITDALGDGSRFSLKLTYIQQDAPRGLAHAVSSSRDFLGDDDFVMYLGDIMLPEGITQVRECFSAQRPDAQVVVHKVSDPSDFGVAELGTNGEILSLQEKPAEPRSDLALTGVYFFTAAIHQAVASIEPSARGELEITDAIQWLLEAGADVRAAEYDGYWQDTGHVSSVLECNRKVLDLTQTRIQGAVDEDSVISGAVVVEAGARIVRSHIQGPAVVGAGSLVEDSHIGPYTAIGEDCALHDTRIRDSIALDRARVSHLSLRCGSLIGRSATVDSTGGCTAQHRVVVGDHAHIEVAA